MVRRWFIVVCFLLLVGFDTTYRGNWVDAEGRYHNVVCPAPSDFVERSRMPQNCVAHRMGVWLERGYYKNFIIAKKKAEKKSENLEKVVKLQEQRIRDLETRLKLKIVLPETKCSCLTEIFSSALVSTAGCVLWNQLP